MKTSAWAGIALFLYVWLMVGFSAGTATLLGPAQWITAVLRGTSWSAWEDGAMKTVIVVYVALSFLLARALTGIVRRTRSSHLRLGIPGVATMTAGLCLWGWMNPSVYATIAGGTTATTLVRIGGGPEFEFGAYPDRTRLAELKRDGYDGVVSLQHPAVVPFEPPGIAAEKQAAKDLGLEFIHAPMLPWISDNEESLEVIRQLARNGSGRFYIHCGLGRDRTNVVKRMLQKLGTDVRTAGNAEARTFASRLKERGPIMQRGHFREIEKDVWLVPYPNQHELYGHMLAGQVEHVLVLLDETDAQQAGWIGELRPILEQHDVDATWQSLRATERAKTADALAFARRLPRPLAIVVPFTPPHPGAELAEMVAAEWTALPAVASASVGR